MSVEDLQDRLAELAGAVPPSPEDPLVGIAARANRARRRVRVAGASAAVAVLLIGSVVWIATDRSDTGRLVAGPAPSATSLLPAVPGATPAQLAAFHWSRLPSSPFRGDYWGAVAWTGRELVVWDGLADTYDPVRPSGHAAAYDPVSGKWRMIATPAGLAPRADAVTLWTGREVVVIGGTTGTPSSPANDGAYDPVTDHWRLLPPRPATLGQYLVAVWTGHEALVISGSRAAATYDPTTNRWRSLPELPEPAERDLMQLIPVWAGDHLLLWSEWSHTITSGNTMTGTEGIDLWRFAFGTSQWSAAGAPPATGPFGIDTATWNGHQVLLAASELFRGAASGPGPTINRHGYLYDPTTNTYTPIAHGPVDDGATGGLWTGGALVRLDQAAGGGPQEQFTPGDAAAWDPATNTWTTLPRAPIVYSSDYHLVWTGHEILAFGIKDGALFSP